jgi:hypothetical protein
MLPILEELRLREREAARDIAFWKRRAAYWENRYWKSVYTDMQRTQDDTANLIKVALETTLALGKQS